MNKAMMSFIYISFVKQLMHKYTLGLLLVLCCLCGCIKKDSGCTFGEDQSVAPGTETQALKKYLDSAGITAVADPRGFYYKIVNKGTGATPSPCSQITVTYTGSLTNGTVFDKEASVIWILGSLIDGWRLGLPLIQRGGEIWLYVPPSLGHGSTPYQASSVTIPANSILIFNIVLNNVQ